MINKYAFILAHPYVSQSLFVMDYSWAIPFLYKPRKEDNSVRFRNICWASFPTKTDVTLGLRYKPSAIGKLPRNLHFQICTISKGCLDFIFAIYSSIGNLIERNPGYIIWVRIMVCQDPLAKIPSNTISPCLQLPVTTDNATFISWHLNNKSK